MTDHILQGIAGFDGITGRLIGSKKPDIPLLLYISFRIAYLYCFLLKI